MLRHTQTATIQFGRRKLVWHHSWDVYICMHVYLCNECVPHLVSMYLSGWSCFSNAICPLTTCKPIVFTHVDARIHLYIHYRDEFDLLCKVYIRVEHYATW